MSYHKISSRLWTDIAELDLKPKTLAVYLLSSQHTNRIGCFRLPFDYVAFDLNCTRDIVAVHFKELERVKFCQYDSQLCWVLIPNFLKWSPLENWNMGKAAAKLIDQVPRKSSLYAPLLDAVLGFCPRFLPGAFLDTLKNERASRS
jgi:hypothetical protein